MLYVTVSNDAAKEELRHHRIQIKTYYKIFGGRMKTRTLCLFFVIISLYLNAFAQVEDDAQKTKFGVGISLEPLHVFTLGSTFYSTALLPVSIYFSVNRPSVSLQPEFGLYSYSYESGGSNNTASIVKVGLGALFSVAQGPSSRTYLGPRMGLLFISQSSSSTGPTTSTSDRTETDFTIGLATGGEYYVSSQFSVGGEAQVNYYSFGNPETTTTPASGSSSNSDRTQSFISTSGLFFLRFYF